MGRRKVDTSQLLKTKKTIAKVFKQRKQGIIKKAFELSRLCDVEVGVIIYGPEGDSPLAWPNESETLNKILRRYQKKIAKEPRKRAEDVPCSANQVDGTAQGKDEIKLENAMWDEMKIDGFSIDQLLELACSLGSKIEAVKAKIDALRSNQVIAPCRFEEVQSYGGDVQLEEGMMMMIMPNDDVILPDFPCNDQFQVTDQYAQFLERLRCEQDVLMEMTYGEGCRDLSNMSTLFDNGPSCLSYPSVDTARDEMNFGPSNLLNMDTSVGNGWSCLRCPSVGTAGDEMRSGTSYLLNTDTSSVDSGQSCQGCPSTGTTWEYMGSGLSYPLHMDSSLDFGPSYPNFDNVPDPSYILSRANNHNSLKDIRSSPYYFN